jgi:hypothetical protein
VLDLLLAIGKGRRIREAEEADRLAKKDECLGSLEFRFTTF